jgi:hypothetical protein
MSLLKIAKSVAQHIYCTFKLIHIFFRRKTYVVKSLGSFSNLKVLPKESNIPSRDPIPQSGYPDHEVHLALCILKWKIQAGFFLS